MYWAWSKDLTTRLDGLLNKNTDLLACLPGAPRDPRWVEEMDKWCGGLAYVSSKASSPEEPSLTLDWGPRLKLPLGSKLDWPYLTPNLLDAVINGWEAVERALLEVRLAVLHTDPLD